MKQAKVRMQLEGLRRHGGCQRCDGTINGELLIEQLRYAGVIQMPTSNGEYRYIEVSGPDEEWARRNVTRMQTFGIRAIGGKA